MTLSDFLALSLFSNPIYKYIIFSGAVLLFLLLSVLVNLVLKKILDNFTARTKTKLDDIIIEKIRFPLMLGFVIMGIYSGGLFLFLPAQVRETFNALLKALFTATIAWFIISFVDAVIFHYVTPMMKRTGSNLDKHLVPLLRKFTKILLLIITGIMIINNLGFDVTSIIAGLGIGGVALALASKDLLSNLFGGVAIIADRPFRIGDTVEMLGEKGKVKQIGLRTTVIENFAGRRVTMPNAKVADSVIINISSEPARKITVQIGLAANTSNKKMQKAMDLVTGILARTEGIYQKKDPVIYFSSFGDYTANLTLVYWINGNIALTQDLVNKAIKDQFEKHGLEVPYPTSTIHLKQ